MIQHSYDIFDTCFTRLCGDPKDIFMLMAHKIFGDTCTDTMANDFLYMRVRAEIEATATHKENTTLNNIYNQLDFSVFTNKTIDQLVELEYSIEDLNLRPVKPTLDEINAIHKDGGRIIYISDMYLSSLFLKSILNKFGFWKECDTIYVSCECGCTKNSGKLYDYVEKNENLQGVQWFHHGDNKISDIKKAKEKGIKTKLVNTGYTPIQNLLLSHCSNTTSHNNQMALGVLRSMHYEFENSEVALFATDLIAPIYVPFVYNVLKDASARNIKKLYFLARDGYIFYKIAEAFGPKFPNVEIRYLYVSRKSLYLPSIQNINKESLGSLIVDTKHSNIKEKMDNLQLDIDDEFFRRVEMGDSPIDVILSNPIYKRQVEEKIESQRILAVEYFKQEGLASYQSDTAIVDLRGTRRCQKCISSILETAGYSRVYGYYLEAVHDRIYPEVKDEYRAFLFADNIAKNPLFYGLHTIKDVLEHYYSVTPYQRTAGYTKINNLVKPIFDNDEIDANVTKFIMDINIQICQRFAERLITLGIEDTADEILTMGFIGLASFMRNPEKKYLLALVNIKASQTSHKTRNIVCKITPSSILKHNITWYEGSIKYTFGNFGLHLFNKSLPLIKRIYKWTK